MLSELFSAILHGLTGLFLNGYIDKQNVRKHWFNELNLDRCQRWPIFKRNYHRKSDSHLHCHFWQHCFHIEIIFLTYNEIFIGPLKIAFVVLLVVRTL